MDLFGGRGRSESHQFVLDAIDRKDVGGIPIRGINLMDPDLIDEIACEESGSYFKDPERTYIRCLRNIGVDYIDRFVPRKPMEMAKYGYGQDIDGTDTCGGFVR